MAWSEEESRNDALVAMKALSVIPRQRHSEIEFADWYNQGTVLMRLGVQTNISPYTWLGLVAFLNRPWLSRVWVVQEVGVARDAVVVCGQKILPWSLLSSIISFLKATTRHDQIPTSQMRADSKVAPNAEVPIALY